MEDAIQVITKLLDEIQKNLFSKAKETLIEKTTTVSNYNDFKEKLKTKGGFIKAAWCGKSTCEEEIKDETGATIRLKPLIKESSTDNCLCCNEKAEEMVYFAKSY